MKDKNQRWCIKSVDPFSGPGGPLSICTENSTDLIHHQNQPYAVPPARPFRPFPHRSVIRHHDLRRPRSKGTPAEEAQKVIDRFLDAGGNHLDTANVYNAGKSERLSARARAPRRHQRHHRLPV
ncbi:MAG: aldo/keto reductase [Lewinellaceae bacterium]|nr:aldo/keto reductase [Lewinellaceae bacterium]